MVHKYVKSKPRKYKHSTPARKYKHTSGRKGKSWANKISGFLLDTNKFVRDINALQKGSIGDRVLRRVLGKGAGQGIGKITGKK